MQGLMGDCGAPGSAACWKVRGSVGACDGVAAAAAVLVAAAGGEGEHREPKTGRILLQVSFLYPSSSHCFSPSPSQMNKTDLALSPRPTPSKSICKTSVFMPPETILLHVWGYFYLRFALARVCRTSRVFNRGVKQICNRALFRTLFCV